jgi:DNA gyrase/topoisomerase IV subunit B
MNQNNDITFAESVRMRPYMYIGNDGLIGLFTGLISNCIELCETDEIYFEIVISGNNEFRFDISSKHDISPFLRQLLVEKHETNYYLPSVFKIISEKFEVITTGRKTKIHFSVDNNVIKDTLVDYTKLSEKMLQLAMLNRNTEIVTKDKTQKYINQNYYHFPEGIFHLSNRAIKEALGKPAFQLSFDNELNGNKYQILLAYRTDWYPPPLVVSFANNVSTTYGGSLVNGVLEGLISACKAYVKEQQLSTYKIKQKKFLNGLILICAVRGKEYIYGGSFKEILENEDIQKDAKKIIHTLALDFFRNEKVKANEFLWRFDTSQLTSGMY